MIRSHLQARSKKWLADLAMKRGIPGSHAMGKDQLVRSLAALRNGRRKSTKPRRSRSVAKAKGSRALRNGKHKVSARSTVRRAARHGENGNSVKILGVARSREL